MTHGQDTRDDELIELGAVSVETRGVPNQPQLDAIGTLGASGLSDD